jgi:hypothetical protein
LDKEILLAFNLVEEIRSLDVGEAVPTSVKESHLNLDAINLPSDWLAGIHSEGICEYEVFFDRVLGATVEFLVYLLECSLGLEYPSNLCVETSHGLLPLSLVHRPDCFRG